MRGWTRVLLMLLFLLGTSDWVIAERVIVDQGIADTGSDVTIDVPGGDLRDGIFRVGNTTLTGLAISNFDTGNLVGENRGVIEFPLFGRPMNMQSDHAVVTFPTFYTDSGSPVPIRVDGYLGDGAITNEEFSPDNYIATLTLPNKLAPSGPVSIEVTDFIRELLSFHELEVTYAGFAFRQLTVSGAGSTLYHNFRLDDEPHAMLIIDYTPVTVPEPSGAVLAAVGAMLAFVTLRRCKS